MKLEKDESAIIFGSDGTYRFYIPKKDLDLAKTETDKMSDGAAIVTVLSIRAAKDKDEGWFERLVTESTQWVYNYASERISK